MLASNQRQRGRYNCRHLLEVHEDIRTGDADAHIPDSPSGHRCGICILGLLHISSRSGLGRASTVHASPGERLAQHVGLLRSMVSTTTLTQPVTNAIWPGLCSQHHLCRTLWCSASLSKRRRLITCRGEKPGVRSSETTREAGCRDGERACRPEHDCRQLFVSIRPVLRIPKPRPDCGKYGG